VEGVGAEGLLHLVGADAEAARDLVDVLEAVAVLGGDAEVVGAEERERIDAGDDAVPRLRSTSGVLLSSASGRPCRRRLAHFALAPLPHCTERAHFRARARRAYIPET